MNENERRPRRKRRSSEEVAARLIQAAQSEFQRCGYAGATTAAIARAADTTEAQLFRSFASKAALFQEAVFRPLNAHLERFNQDHLAAADDGTARVDHARRYISELQHFVEQHAALLRAVILAGDHGRDQGIDPIGSLGAYFEQGAAAQSARIDGTPRVDPRLMVRVSFGAVLANILFKDWLFPADLANNDAVNRAIVDFVLDGINANASGAPPA